MLQNKYNAENDGNISASDGADDDSMVWIWGTFDSKYI